jgi:hypothetical protein
MVPKRKNPPVKAGLGKDVVLALFMRLVGSKIRGFDRGVSGGSALPLPENITISAPYSVATGGD